MARHPFRNRRTRAVQRVTSQPRRTFKPPAPSRDRPSRRSITEVPFTRQGQPAVEPLPGEPTPLAQPEREEQRIETGRFKGSEIVTSTKRLQELLDDQLITADQFEASRERILGGFSGVDPFGFRPEGQRDITGRLIQTGRGKFDPTIPTGRRDAGAPLQDPLAGVAGQPGVRGFQVDRPPQDIQTDLATFERTLKERSASEEFISEQLLNLGFTTTDQGLMLELPGNQQLFLDSGLFFGTFASDQEPGFFIPFGGTQGGAFIIDPETGEVIGRVGAGAKGFIRSAGEDRFREINGRAATSDEIEQVLDLGMQVAQEKMDEIRGNPGEFFNYLRRNQVFGTDRGAPELEAIQKAIKIREGTFVTEEDEATLNELRGTLSFAEEEEFATGQQRREGLEVLEQRGERAGQGIDRDLASSAAAATEISPEAQQRTSEGSAKLAGLNAALTSLGPEGQFLAQSFQGLNNEIMNSISSQGRLVGGQLGSVQNTDDIIQGTLGQLMNSYNNSFGLVQNQLNSIKEKSDASLALSEKSQREKLIWDEQQTLVEGRKLKRKNHESMVAQLALGGGFGQEAGLREIREADAEYDNRFNDLKVEYGFSRTDLAAKFAGLRLENENNYITNSLTNLKESLSALERLSFQSIASTQARSTAEQNIISGAWKNETDLRKELAKNNVDLAKEILDSTSTQRSNAATEQIRLENVAWREFTFDFNKTMQQENNDFRRMDTAQQRLTGRIAQDKIIKDADEVDGFYRTVETAFSRTEELTRSEADKKSFNAADNALITGFMKMTDPGSVVRESEFARIPDNLSLVEKWRSKFLRLTKGGVLTPSERKELFTLSTDLNNSWQKLIGQRRQRYYMQLDTYNSSVDPQFRLGPGQFGLPVKSTFNQQSNLENLVPPDVWNDSPNPFSQDVGVKFNNVTDNDLTSASIGGKSVKGQPYLVNAVQLADQEFFKDFGKHIQIGSHFRTRMQQERLFAKSQAGEIGKAAAPGKSFHEKGLAIDVVNWEQAQPYLARYGLLNKLRGDRGHFSIGEFS